MLEKIKIKNFQSHVGSEIMLDPGINAITGSSDVGKSSIFRAINWLRLNRPIGSAFINHNAKGEPVEVSLTLDGITVTRTKSKSKNEYRLNKKPFKVVGSDVPEEVNTFLNMNDISIQGQHDTYFLLQSSPGEVAKRLNEVAGFEIIDAVTKDVKSDITKNTADINYTSEHLKELEESIEEYANLDSVEEQLNILQNELAEHQINNNSVFDLENTIDKITETEECIEKYKNLGPVEKQSKDLQNIIVKYQNKSGIVLNIENTLSEITETEESITNMKEWLHIADAVQPILDDAAIYTEKQNELRHTSKLMGDIEELEDRVRGLSDRTGYEEKVGSIGSIVNEYIELLQALKSLVLITKNIIDCSSKVGLFEKNIKINEEKLDVLVKENEMCPLCGIKLTNDRMEHIKHLI